MLVMHSIFNFCCINWEKYSLRKNFQFPVFSVFTDFGISRTRIEDLKKNVSVCLWQKIYDACNSETKAHNFTRLYLVAPCQSSFGGNRSTGGAGGFIKNF